MVSLLKQLLEKNKTLNKFLLQPYRNYRLQNYYQSLLPLNHLSESERQMWLERIRKVKLSKDNAKIIKHVASGTIKGGKLIMHNGLVIDPLSYYGAPVMRMLMENQAVHEPQEEFVFQEVLKQMPENACMVELGCYWGFYSMWFNSKIKGAKNVLIDNHDGIQRAKANFAMNTLNAEFMEAYIGKANPASPVRITNVDEIVGIFNIDFIHILHCDIQGYELEMLQTMPNQLMKNGIGYIFISTHSNELHYDCIKFLEQNGFSVTCHADLDNSFSEDGLIVAKSNVYDGIDQFEISMLQNV
jgi:hypothetical protein